MKHRLGLLLLQNKVGSFFHLGLSLVVRKQERMFAPANGYLHITGVEVPPLVVRKCTCTIECKESLHNVQRGLC